MKTKIFLIEITIMLKYIIDENFPDYISENKEKFKDWII